MSHSEVYGTRAVLNVGLGRSRYTAILTKNGVVTAWCGHSHRDALQAERCATGLPDRYETELRQLDEIRAAREKREREASGVA